MIVSTTRHVEVISISQTSDGFILISIVSLIKALQSYFKMKPFLKKANDY